MVMMRRLISAIAVLLSAALAYAQPTIKVQAPNLVGVNEQFNVTFVISGEDAPSDFEWSAGEDFQLVWGPQKGRSSSTSIVNGHRSKTSQTTYTYILMPKKTGHFRLQAAQVKVKGKHYSSDMPEVEVVSDGAKSQGGASSSSGSQGGGNAAQSAGSVGPEDMFLRLTLSKRKLMVGEPVTATLKLYQRVNIAGIENAKFPDFNGFWSQEVQAPSNIEFKRESLDEKIYNTAVLRSWTLIPQKAGEIRIAPAELVCLVNVRMQRQSTGSIFDDFFMDDFQTVRKRVTTDPLTVTVSALPAGAPATFGGGVGQFRIAASLTRDSLQTHDAASLVLTVTGKGNVALLEAPRVSFPPDFEVYDVKTSDVQGGKQFEYPFIPRSHGDFTIGPVEYSYYDISTGKYVTLKTQALPVRVAKGSAQASAGESSGQIVRSPSGKDVRNIGSDIRYISTRRPSFRQAGTFFVGTPAFFVILVLLAAVCSAVYFGLRRSAALRADVVGSKNRAANKMARKRLARSEEFLKKNLYTAFYEELHKALFGYVSDKLNMDISDMSKENISAKLMENGVPEALASDYVALLDACEYARYAPADQVQEVTAQYDKAVRVISEIDGCMNRNRHKGRGGASAAVVAALLAILPAGTVQAAPDRAEADSLWSAGVVAYAAEDWAGAEKAWTGIAEMGLESADLYFNIGNACFREDDIAHAVLNYERALRLDPSHSDARFNLEFTRTLLQDKIESVPEFFLSVWMRSLSRLVPSDVWAGIGIGLFALTLALTLLFLLGHGRAARMTGFASGIVSLLLCVFSISMAARQRADYFREDGAVVVRAVSPVKSSPSSDSSRDLFILHEGTKVKVLDSVGGWRNIELPDGRQGWVASSDVEVI